MTRAVQYSGFYLGAFACHLQPGHPAMPLNPHRDFGDSTLHGSLVPDGDAPAHDFVDGANSVIISMADGASKKRARGWLIANSAAPGVGLIGASLVTVPTNFLVGSLAVFAGGFLHVGASELLPRSRADSTPLRNGGATIAGFLAFYLVAQGK